ncbi:hypothetical protein TIFTF001_002471 [Ficus carica]|uniref:Disease resistance N-terminal domain-containing protein n=1 Tax=Ficus carica TaxID=3494 RepID=A0AA87Z4L8_FICCA|nr:hypothetical protein TIFTF001_002471 [Ficus carica]
MALELVGGALLSGLFQTLFERMASREVVDFFRAKKLNSKMLKKLKIMLLSANAVLNSAEEMQSRNPTVKEWLDELKEVTHELEDLMEAIKTAALSCKLRRGEVGSSRNSNQLLSLVSSSFTAEVEPEVAEIMERLELILSQKDYLGLKEGGSNRRSRSLASPLVEESDIYGRKHDDSLSVGSNCVHHLSYEKQNIDSVVDVVISAEVKFLRTFLPLGCPGVGEELMWNKSLLDELLPRARYLRVLSLSQYPITDLPSSIGNLSHLSLAKLPANMGSLINLRHLDTRGTKLKEMPAGMCNMKDLQTLTNVVLGKHCASNLKDLRELKHIRGGLSISGIENVVDVGDLPELKRLYIIRFPMVTSIGDEFYSNGSFVFKPFKSLEKLVFRNMLEWQQWSFPECNGNEEDAVFPRLRELHLEYCPRLTGGLPNRQIESLIVTQCEKLTVP